MDGVMERLGLGGVCLRTHERVERRTVAQFVRCGDLVLEGGAGIGSVTRVLLDSGATVHAYEPGLAPFEELDRLRAAYPRGRLSAYNVALAPLAGEIALHVYEPWYANRTTSLGGEVPSFSIAVPAQSWRYVLAEHPWQGLVLDVEGEEYQLFECEMLPAMLPASLEWMVVELHGRPAELATLVHAVERAMPIVSIEVNEASLVCGCRRKNVCHGGDAT